MSVEKTTEVSVELLGKLYARALHYEIMKSYLQGVLTGVIVVGSSILVGVGAAEAHQAAKKVQRRKQVKDSLRIAPQQGL